MDKRFIPSPTVLGSTVALTDVSGKVTGRFRYDAFGLPRAYTANYQATVLSAASYRFLFTGREWVAGFGLADHRHRYYKPALGRWLSTDALPYAQIVEGPNLYMYVRNQPLSKIDRYGDQTWTTTYYNGVFDDLNLVNHILGHGLSGANGNQAARLNYTGICTENGPTGTVVKVDSANSWKAWIDGINSAHIDVRSRDAASIEINDGDLAPLVINSMTYLTATCSTCNSAGL